MWNLYIEVIVILVVLVIVVSLLLLTFFSNIYMIQSCRADNITFGLTSNKTYLIVQSSFTDEEAYLYFICINESNNNLLSIIYNVSVIQLPAVIYNLPLKHPNCMIIVLTPGAIAYYYYPYQTNSISNSYLVLNVSSCGINVTESKYTCYPWAILKIHYVLTKNSIYLVSILGTTSFPVNKYCGGLALSYTWNKGLIKDIIG